MLIPMLMLSSLAACRPDDPSGFEIATRLITEDSDELLRGEHIYQQEQTFEWSFATEQDLEPWRFYDPALALDIEDGRLVAPGNSFPRLIRPTQLEAGAIDRIEVALSGFSEGRLQLYWTHPGQQMHPERRMMLTPGEREKKDQSLFVFDVSLHPMWPGKLTHLRLDVQTSSPAPIRLRSIRGLRNTLDGGQLAQALQRPWKITLDSDIRNALLAPPGIESSHDIDVRPGSLLRFAYGMEATIVQPVDFRVALVADGNAAEPLWSARIDPRQEGQAGVWHDGSVDLSAWAGQKVRLVLDTLSPDTLDLGKGLPYWANPEILAPASRPRPANVVLIVVDTLRADRLSVYGHSRQTSPNIDRWARDQGVIFRNAVAAAPWTLPSHVSMFTGLDALSHGANHGAPLAAHVETLADRLRTAGYSTRAITGGVYLHPRYGMHQGFDRFRYWPSSADQKDELADGAARARTWLADDPDRPTFLFLHTYEVHSPFHPRQPYLDQMGIDPAAEELAARLASEKVPLIEEEGFQARRRFAFKGTPESPGKKPFDPAYLPQVNELYDGGVAYADDLIGALLAELPSDDTLVLLTSDHGEALGERGLAAHAYLYDFNLLVPLIVALPGGDGAGRSITRQVRSVDLLPTILDYTGIDIPPGLDGVSLRRLIDDPEADFPRDAWSYAGTSNYGVSLRRANRQKLIFNNSPWRSVHGQIEVFDLETDPLEETHQADRERDIAGFREQLSRRLQAGFRGLRIDVVHAADEPRDLVFRGHSVRTNTVKALELGDATVTWNYEHKGPAVHLPAASEITLFIEDVRLPSRLFVMADNEPSCVVDLADLGSEPKLLTLPGCSQPPTENEPATRLEVRLLGEALAPLQKVEEIDPELEQKLRALGYLN